VKAVSLYLGAQPLALAAQLTTRAHERMRGWLGKRHVGPGDALLISPCNAVHTCFMRTPIDVVFIDRQGRVLAVHANVGAWRYRMHWRARMALELAPGRSRALGIERGQARSVRPIGS
jgi:uncharacterized membrane protein (UPF0127 family)